LIKEVDIKMKVYFWIISILMTIGLGADILTVSGVIPATQSEISQIANPLSVLDYVILYLALFGIYGYCYHKQFFTKTFWKFYSMIFLVWNVSYGYYSLFVVADDEIKKAMEVPNEYAVLGLAFVVGMSIVVLPITIGLWKYANKPKETE
jgi:hypothetical protein